MYIVKRYKGGITLGQRNHERQHRHPASILIDSEDMYGYQIVKALKENSDELYSMSEGTLYPALKRLEKKGWIRSYWQEPDTGARRKYYAVTEDGKAELSRKLQEWNNVNT